MRKALLAASAALLLAAGPAAAQQKTIKIGFISTFSGPVAVIGHGFDHHRYAMRGIPLIQYLIIVFHFLALGPFDSGFDAVLGHVNSFRILKTTTQRRVRRRVGASCFYCYGYFLSNARKLLGHPVPAGKHRGFSNFKYATHIIVCSL